MAIPGITKQNILEEAIDTGFSYEKWIQID